MSTNEKPIKPTGGPFAGLERELGEALERFIRSDPEELAEAIEKTRKRADEITQSAAGRRERLRSAGRRPARKYGSSMA